MALLKIVFMGSDAIALPALEWLVGEGASIARIVGVFTQPDRPVGRGQKVAANAIKTWAQARQLPLFQPEKLTEEDRLHLAALQADVALVMAYGHLLKDDFISTPRLGTLNLHASILPKYRGASPIQSAIASGESETGVTLMRIVRKLDAGPVADSEKVQIMPHNTATEIEAKLAFACVPLLARNLPRLAAGTLVFVPQDEGFVSFCRRLTKEDGHLDFRASAAELAARINGLYPWPGCVVQHGEQSIKVGLAEAVDFESSQSPGSVLGLAEGALGVATSRGVLRLLRLQRPGGRMLDAADFLRGYSLSPDAELISQPMSPLVGTLPFGR